MFKFFKIKSKKQKGFTLLELLLVISIIVILSSVLLANFNKSQMKARDSQRINDLTQIKTALELFYNHNGYYPQSNCGWDCDEYRYSYESSWDLLATDLSPYMSTLPKDPINSSCPPWDTNCYSYTYGDVGRNTYPSQFTLTAQLEDTNSPYRCSVKNYRWYFDNRAWCSAFGGNYSNQIYEIGNRP